MNKTEQRKELNRIKRMIIEKLENKGYDVAVNEYVINAFRGEEKILLTNLDIKKMSIIL